MSGSYLQAVDISVGSSSREAHHCLFQRKHENCLSVLYPQADREINCWASKAACMVEWAEARFHLDSWLLQLAIMIHHPQDSEKIMHNIFIIPRCWHPIHKQLQTNKTNKQTNKVRIRDFSNSDSTGTSTGGRHEHHDHVDQARDWSRSATIPARIGLCVPRWPIAACRLSTREEILGTRPWLHICNIASESKNSIYTS